MTNREELSPEDTTTLEQENYATDLAGKFYKLYRIYMEGYVSESEHAFLRSQLRLAAIDAGLSESVINKVEELGRSRHDELEKLLKD
jgi:hypothetical protein